jgi:hypothetical protein
MEKDNLLIVIFSYNRVLQLDCLIRTIFRRVSNPEWKAIVIYYSTGEHSRGYEKMITEYQDQSRISFIRESGQKNNFFRELLPLLFRNRNFYRYLKHPYLRHKLRNMKKITETALADSGCEFTMFLTDDGYFYRDVEIPEGVLNEIRQDPLQVSYRMYVGKNLANFPEKITGTGSLYRWNYYDPALTSHWAYPFSVDATIYHTQSLLKIIKPVFYHIPTTMESFVVTHCKTRKLLGTGLSPLVSNYVGLYINRVSLVGNNFAGRISVEMLNTRYLEGYRLEFEFVPEPNVQTLIPDKIILRHHERETIEIIPDKSGR